MTNGTEKYIGTVEYLGKLYDFCNAKLFNGELTKPVITVQQDARNKANGWWSVNKVWKENDTDDGEHELNIAAQALNRSVREIAETLIHEMCHQYASTNALQDCSRSGTYHNKLFKRIAETHGLTVKCVAKIGWACTDLTNDTAILIDSFIADNPDGIIYRLPMFNGRTVKASSTRKYKCPVCGISVRATKEVNVVCADCDELMIAD